MSFWVKIRNLNWRKIGLIVAFLFVIIILALLFAIIPQLMKTGLVLWDWEHFGIPIITVAIIGPIGTVILYFWGRIWQLIRPTGKDYANVFSAVWKSADQFTAQEVLGPIRSASYKGFNDDYYYKRNEDNLFRKKIQEAQKADPEKTPKRHVLVSGRPLAGKTRMVYEYLKFETNTDVLVPNYIDINADDFKIPPTKRGRNHILFLDDLQRYINYRNFEFLISEIILKPEVIVIATSRSEVEFQKVNSWFQQKVNFGLDDLFLIIEIKSLDEEVAIDISKKLKKEWIKIDFDGTVGSIFFELSEMKRRYEEECGKDAQAILKSLKWVYLGLMYKDKDKIPEEWVKSVYKSLYDKELKIKDWEWNIEILEKLEFLKLENSIFLTEEVYVDEIFEKNLKLSFEDYCKLEKIFSDNVKASRYLASKLVDFYEEDIRDLSSLKKAIEIFEVVLKKLSNDKKAIDYLYSQFNLALVYVKLSRHENYKENVKKHDDLVVEVHKNSDKDKLLQTMTKFTIELRTLYEGYDADNSETVSNALHEIARLLEIFKENYKHKYWLARSGYGEGLSILYLLTKNRDDFEKALKVLKETLKHYRLNFYPRKHWEIQFMISDLYARAGIHGEKDMFDKSIEIKDLILEKYPVKNDFLYSHNLYKIALIHSLQNNRNLAIEYLEKAITINNGFIEYAKEDKEFDNIRDSTEFKNLIKEK